MECFRCSMGSRFCVDYVNAARFRSLCSLRAPNSGIALPDWTVEQDEIGNLARSFNAMADRIQTLLTAERRLLQDVSHELRSPLSRLSLAFELMKDASDSEAAVSRVRREINRLSQLVATLLEVNRSESDPSSMRTQPVPVASLTEEIVEDSGGEAEVRNIRIETQIHCSTV